jgi:hypothetical protein
MCVLAFWIYQIHTTEEVKAMKGLSICLMVVAFLYFCLVLFLRSRIDLALGIIKESARCVGHMPTVLAFPLCQAIAVLIFTVIWVVYSLYLASSGTLVATVVNGVTVHEMEYTKDAQLALVYMVGRGGSRWVEVGRGRGYAAAAACHPRCAKRSCEPSCVMPSPSPRLLGCMAAVAAVAAG